MPKTAHVMWKFLKKSMFNINYFLNDRECDPKSPPMILKTIFSGMEMFNLITQLHSNEIIKAVHDYENINRNFKV